MSPAKQGYDQHEVLHAQWPPPTCCLCNCEAERDAALAQVAALRETLHKCYYAARDWQETGIGDEGNLSALVCRTADPALFADTAAAAQEFVQRIRREAMERAAQIAESVELRNGGGRGYSPVAAAIRALVVDE